jgi:diguanylate cyclase (GGDEF)-like protein/PAS domain S-box-containing protein
MLFSLDNLELGDLTTPVLKGLPSTSAQGRATQRPQPETSSLPTQHLFVIQDLEGERTLSLDAATYSIGRHQANTIVLPNLTVSRHHAILLRLPDPVSGNYFFRIIDGNLRGKRSQNGIWVNGQRCFSHDLKDQDVISFSHEVKAIYRLVRDAAAVAAESSSAFSANLRWSEPQEPFAGEDLEHFGDAVLVRLSSFPEMMPHPIFEIDLGGHITYLNPAAASEFPELRTTLEHPLKQGLDQVQLQDAGQYWMREVTVGDRVYEQSIHCIPQSQLIRSYLVDVTQRKQMEQALRTSEERYAVAARGANDGLWDWDLTTNSMYFSPRWKAMLGYGEEEIQDQAIEWLARIHPEDCERVQAAIDQHLKGEIPHFESDFRLRHKRGEYRWYRSRGMAIHDDEGEPYRIAGSLTDITEHQMAKEQLQHDAFYDPMTGLPNRLLLMDRLEQAIRDCQHHQSQCTILFLDLDRFKLINDSLGHMVGDQLLIAVAQQLSRCIRSGDTVARLGGDEFVILLPRVDGVEVAIAIARRIQETLNQGFILEGQEVFTSTSIGIAMGDPTYKQAEDLLRDADAAMYKAKHQGKNRYAVFRSNMHTQALSLLQLETDLRRAIERQEFLLHYQPIVCLRSQKLMGFEALTRWQHPERGLVPPTEFIPLAEDTGMILSLGQWLLREACGQLQQWQYQFPTHAALTMSVNISSREFAQPDFVTHVSRMLAETQLAPSRLKLEITEGALMDHAQRGADKLDQLKALGVQLSIDDFGTGYSSLSYLQTFPIDTLKVDRSFVDKLDHSESREIVKTIITLAHNLKLDVIAEGVETQAQFHLLREMDCEYAQGYLFSRPVDAQSATALLTQSPIR